MATYNDYQKLAAAETTQPILQLRCCKGPCVLIIIMYTSEHACSLCA